MKQARGRSVRRGQEKVVHIYHCVTAWTIEVDILEFRTGKRIVVEDGKALGKLAGRRLSKTGDDDDNAGGAESGVGVGRR